MLDDLHRGVAALDLVHDGLLDLQGLVDGEEVAHLLEGVAGQLGDVVVHVVVGVVLADGDYLLVHLAAVLHRDDAYRPAAHEGHGLYGLGADDQHVQRVPVVAVGAGDKAVVGGVMRRRVEDAVQDDEAGLLVELVFLLAALRYLDDGDEFLGAYALGVDVVPDVGHNFTPTYFL